jgi:hypothetical protein
MVAKASTVAKESSLQGTQYRYEGFNFIVVNGKRKQLSANLRQSRPSYDRDGEVRDLVSTLGGDVSEDNVFSFGDPLAALLALEELQEAGEL